jgi:hypothetical protein
MSGKRYTEEFKIAAVKQGPIVATRRQRCPSDSG